MAEPVRLAVDLGTTHTVAVVRRGGQQPRALLFDGSPLLGSGVYVDEAGTVHTGRDAVRLGANDPERSEPHPKRRVDEGTVLLGSAEVAVEELLAASLRRVVAEARQAGVEPTEATVLTCPADWGQPRRAVLLAAARRAGLGQVRLLDEPVAAAAYCVQVLGQQVPAGGCLGIFDFGGGTLDVTVVRHEAAGPRVLATGGLDDLGGLDVDDALVAHLGQLIGMQDAELWRRLREPRTPAERRDRQAFWTEVRAAKEMLSRTSMAPVNVPGREEPLHLTREELDRIATPLVARAVDETRRVLQRAGVEPSTLAGLLLVGGSSRMPMVATRLHTRLGVAPSVPEQPELPVAYGALVYAPPAAQPGQAPVGWPGGVPVSSGWPTPPGSPVGPPSYPTSPAFGPSTPVSGPGAPLSGMGAPVSGMGGADNPASGAPYTPPSYGPTSAPPYGPASVPPGAKTTGPSFPPGPYPPIGRPAPVRRRRPVRAVLATLMVATLAACTLGVVRGTQWVGGLFDTGDPTTNGGTGTGGFKIPGLGTGEDDGQSGPSDSLKPVAERQPDGPGATGVTIIGDAFVTATAGMGVTRVTAVSTAEGEPRWTKDVKMEPTAVHLTPVGDLVIVDGERSVLDGGKDVRAVLAAKDGKLLWNSVWEDRSDVAYYGTDAVVEVLDGIYDNAVERVDLRTGNRTRKRDGNDDLLTSPAHRIEPMRTFPEVGAPAAPGVLPATAYGLREKFTATTTVVELDTEKQRGYELDAGTLKPRGSGALPLDEQLWTAFDGLAIGKQHDSVSGGRAVLAAYTVPGFKPAWQVPLAAGHDIERVKPCGPHLVCAAIEKSSEKGGTIAIDTRTHEQAWEEVEVELSDDETWYVDTAALVLGDAPFEMVDTPRILDFGGKELHKFDQFTNAVAVADGRMALRSFDGMTGQWQIRVVDMASGQQTGAIRVGTDLPDQVYLDGDFVAVTTKDRRTLLAKVGDLG